MNVRSNLVEEESALRGINIFRSIIVDVSVVATFDGTMKWRWEERMPSGTIRTVGKKYIDNVEGISCSHFTPAGMRKMKKSPPRNLVIVIFRTLYMDISDRAACGYNTGMNKFIFITFLLL